MEAFAFGYLIQCYSICTDSTFGSLILKVLQKETTPTKPQNNKHTEFGFVFSIIKQQAKPKPFYPWASLRIEQHLTFLNDKLNPLRTLANIRYETTHI